MCIRDRLLRAQSPLAIAVGDRGALADAIVALGVAVTALAAVQSGMAEIRNTRSARRTKQMLRCPSKVARIMPKFT
eukprot:6480442-Alexandrium_andersonii.AAC.1